MKPQQFTDWLIRQNPRRDPSFRRRLFESEPKAKRQWPIDLAIIVAIGTVIFLVAFVVLMYGED